MSTNHILVQVTGHFLLRSSKFRFTIIRASSALNLGFQNTNYFLLNSFAHSSVRRENQHLGQY